MDASLFLRTAAGRGLKCLVIVAAGASQPVEDGRGRERVCAGIDRRRPIDLSNLKRPLDDDDAAAAATTRV